MGFTVCMLSFADSLGAASLADTLSFDHMVLSPHPDRSERPPRRKHTLHLDRFSQNDFQFNTLGKGVEPPFQGISKGFNTLLKEQYPWKSGVYSDMRLPRL